MFQSQPLNVRWSSGACFWDAAMSKLEGFALSVRKYLHATKRNSVHYPVLMEECSSAPVANKHLTVAFKHVGGEAVSCRNGF